VTELVWSKQARQDLIDIYVQIGLHDAAAAERYFATIQRKIELLGDHPRIGPRRSDIRPSARMLVIAPYLVLYRIEPDTDAGPIARIELVRIVDGRRDLPRLF
jgi:toxin ParE1/3/4